MSTNVTDPGGKMGQPSNAGCCIEPSWSSAFTEEEMRMINELQARMEASAQKPNMNSQGQKVIDMLADLQISCLTIAEECGKFDGPVETNWPLLSKSAHHRLLTHSRFSSSVSSTGVKLGEILRACTDSVCSEMDDVIATVVCRSRKRLKDEHLWASFAIRDMKVVINSIAHQCEQVARKRIADASYIRLGRLYAWAREQRGADVEGGQSECPTNQLRTRLRRRLGRLVWLTRASKRRARSHPLLTSLRHELLRIRTRAIGQLCSEHTAAMGSSENHLLRLDRNESVEVTFHHLIPVQLRETFHHLINKLTSLFMDLPVQVPGLNLSENIEDPEIKAKFWEDLVTRTVIGFYNHLDAATHIESEVDGAVYAGIQAFDSTLVLPNDLESSGSELESVNETKTEATGPPSVSHLNPALVQATLDGFDHHSYASRKRAMPTSIPSFQEDRLASDAVTDSGMPTMDTTREDEQTEEILNVLRRPVAPLKLQTNLDAPSYTASTEVEDEPVSDSNSSSQSSPASSKVNTGDEETSSKTGSDHAKVSKHKSFRSLRTRDSRTPSDDSFSEGEVLSDSEEERAGSLDEVDQQVTELGEKTNIDIEEEEAEELIRMVNEQLRDRTPVSDIDMTELEIMDEWAPPTSSMVMGSRTETELDRSEVAVVEPVLSEAELAALEEARKKIAEISEAALSECGKELDELVLSVEQKKTVTKPKRCTETVPLSLSEDAEASIQRTVCAFNEHVTSVLNNLLHAIPVAGVKKAGAAAPVITGRRGSRLLGMLRAYQQDVVKRMSSNTK